MSSKISLAGVLTGHCHPVTLTETWYIRREHRLIVPLKMKKIPVWVLLGLNCTMDALDDFQTHYLAHGTFVDMNV
jgi:hypothetical protein